ncbi:hypothetical protein BDQ17DRAFT_1425080 [Cyathus striatus]|nr:hypothetical protein BDQ17DRAFT_1425080 [Cyathus striatus]
MDSSCSIVNEYHGNDLIVAPRAICQSCHSFGGPKFYVSILRGTSDMHRNNVIPTGAEREVVELDITFVESEVDRLDTESARLQRSLSTLQHWRDELSVVIPFAYTQQIVKKSFYGTFYRTQGREFIVAPRAICQSCHSCSGPKFFLLSFRETTDLTQLDHEAKSEILNQLNKEISRLQESLEAVKDWREDLRCFEMQERSLFSPVRKLPVDLLHQIFLQPQLHPHILDKLNYPDLWEWSLIRTVTQVSFYWRSVTHSCAPLWYNIDLSPKYRHSSAKFAMISTPFVEKCIALSHGIPLHISLNPGCSTNTLDEKCIKAIAQSAHIWERFEISNGDLLKAIDSHIPDHAILTHLQLLRLYEATHSITLKPAPKLTHLEVQNNKNRNCRITIPPGSPLINIQLKTVYHPLELFHNLHWSQITSFTSINNHFSHGEFYTILQSMPNLLSL